MSNETIEQSRPVMGDSKQNSNTDNAFNYHMLQYALKDYSKNVFQLSSNEYKNVYNKALKSYQTESLAISSPEAKGIVISEVQIESALKQIISRYNTHSEFIHDLENNGLNEIGIRQALYRELLFDAIMQRVSTDIEEISETDIQLFYEMHRNRFDIPEKRVASHILITVNPEFPENTYEAALQRIYDIAEKLHGRANRFHSFAKRFSECPTAMEGGKLGDVVRGQLYPELDAALFELSESEISSIIESELGFHLILCEKIKAGKIIPLNKVFSKIREILHARHQHTQQKSWLDKLQTNHTGN